MSRPHYLAVSALFLFLSLGLVPLACQKTYTLSPLPSGTSIATATNTPAFNCVPQTMLTPNPWDGTTVGIVVPPAYYGSMDLRVQIFDSTYVKRKETVFAMVPSGVSLSIQAKDSYGVDLPPGTYYLVVTGTSGCWVDTFHLLVGSVPTIPPTSTPTVASCTGGTVSTLAGSGAIGAVNATGTAASFNFPAGAAVDSSGNVYVADPYNFMIRKITPGGLVTTLAGSGALGAANGPGASASFDYPYAVAVDSSGNVYVADTINNLIREITPGGVVSTLAGGGPGYPLNGTGTAASFNGPWGIAVDSSGNVYVADQGNQMIRKITPGGVVTTLAGSGSVGFANGPGATAAFYNPFGVAVDAAGNVYVADSYNQLIRKITPGGVVSTLAGTVGVSGSTNATGTAASFSMPIGVAVDAAGNVYVSDSWNNLIRKISPGGVVSTLAGQAGVAGSTNGNCSVSSFNHPYEIAVDASGVVYVADQDNNLIRKIQ